MSDLSRKFEDALSRLLIALCCVPAESETEVVHAAVSAETAEILVIASNVSFLELFISATSVEIVPSA